MENKAHALAAGIFVLVVTVLLAGLAVWLTRDKGTYHLYEVSTQETVTGLQEQAPVRYRGVDVGKVSAIGFDPVARGNVLITLQVEESAPVSQATFAQLGFQGVTGLAFVQLDDGGKPGAPLAPNDSQPPRIPLKPGLFSKLAERGEVIIDQVEKATLQINKLLADDNQKRVAAALDSMGQAAGSVNTLAATLETTVKGKLDPALAAIPPFTVEAGKTMRSLQATSDDIGKTARRLNEKDGPLDRLAEGTQALSTAADAFNAATLPRINQATEDTSRAVRRLSRAVNAINDNPQSLIFGNGAPQPGPGEPGFTAPGGAR